MLRRWLGQPVEHLRDVRSELLLKLVLCDLLGIDTKGLIAAQKEQFEPIAVNLRRRARGALLLDPVEVWRDESSRSILRFLDRLASR